MVSAGQALIGAAAGLAVTETTGITNVTGVGSGERGGSGGGGAGGAPTSLPPGLTGAEGLLPPGLLGLLGDSVPSDFALSAQEIAAGAGGGGGGVPGGVFDALGQSVPAATVGTITEQLGQSVPARTVEQVTDTVEQTTTGPGDTANIVDTVTDAVNTARENAQTPDPIDVPGQGDGPNVPGVPDTPNVPGTTGPPGSDDGFDITDLGGPGAGAIPNAAATTAKTFKEAGDIPSDVTDPLITDTPEGLPVITPAYRAGQITGQAGGEVIDAATDVGGSAADAATDAPGAVADTAGDVGGGAADLLGDAASAVGNNTPSVPDSLQPGGDLLKAGPGGSGGDSNGDGDTSGGRDGEPGPPAARSTPDRMIEEVSSGPPAPAATSRPDRQASRSEEDKGETEKKDRLESASVPSAGSVSQDIAQF